MQIITLNGKAQVKLNSFTTTYQANIVNGTGNVTIYRNLTDGQYTATLSYEGDETFMPSNKSTTFTVKEKKERIDPKLNIMVDNITEGQKAIAVITANNSISCSMELRLNVSSLACPVEIVNGMGNVTIDRNLTAGQYTATVSYEGDDTFMPSNKSTTFTIKEKG